jgi:hypothetical protein
MALRIQRGLFERVWDGSMDILAFTTKALRTVLNNSDINTNTNTNTKCIHCPSHFQYLKPLDQQSIAHPLAPKSLSGDPRRIS